VKDKIHVSGKYQRNATNAFFKYEMECRPKHMKNLETPTADICQQQKANFN